MQRSPSRARVLPRAVLLVATLVVTGCVPEAGRRMQPPGGNDMSRPDDAANLKFSEVFVSPIGRLGLKPTEKLLGLEGERVRIAGYMVHQESRIPGRFLLTARPASVHESHYGLAEDLPPATVHVLCPGADPTYTPGRLEVVGRLRLGNREEPDGRVSVVRLELERLAEAVMTGNHPSSRSNS